MNRYLIPKALRPSEIAHTARDLNVGCTPAAWWSWQNTATFMLHWGKQPLSAKELKVLSHHELKELHTLNPKLSWYVSPSEGLEQRGRGTELAHPRSDARGAESTAQSSQEQNSIPFTCRKERQVKCKGNFKPGWKPGFVWEGGPRRSHRPSAGAMFSVNGAAASSSSKRRLPGNRFHRGPRRRSVSAPIKGQVPQKQVVLTATKAWILDEVGLSREGSSYVPKHQNTGSWIYRGYEENLQCELQARMGRKEKRLRPRQVHWETLLTKGMKGCVTDR
ncbi:hypothetical protein UY3_07946 [Chelonia mydas]|uniref:Uncharacterized protein n=1 Tax=Chelonia mydas TaxID=8469 RepID=M7C398_CHEMY|nr:hypothetical protein UY3_07946 [Chelonia mydas]